MTKLSYLASEFIPNNLSEKCPCKCFLSNKPLLKVEATTSQILNTCYVFSSVLGPYNPGPHMNSFPNPSSGNEAVYLFFISLPLILNFSVVVESMFPLMSFPAGSIVQTVLTVEVNLFLPL